MDTQKSFFAIKHLPSGKLLRLSKSGSYDYELVLNENEPVFQARSAYHLSSVLMQPINVDNSSELHPAWDEFKREDLQPVQVELVLQTQPVELLEGVGGKLIESRPMFRMVAEQYAGRGVLSALDAPEKLLFWVIKGVKPQDLQKYVGKKVLGHDRASVRHVYYVGDVPEEYTLDLKGDSGALLICHQEI